MKKFRSLFLALILALTLCVGLVACGGNSTPTYKLTFEMNGHGEQVAEQVLKADKAPTKPEDPTETGWKFGGWYEDEYFIDAFNFAKPIDEDTTAYAKWMQIYVVTFNTCIDGYTIPEQEVEAGDLANLPSAESMTAAGRKFEGWYLDSGYTIEFNPTTAITQDLPLYAKWSVYYKVTFDRNGRGSQNKVPKPLEYFVEGSKIDRPDDMELNYYRFIGWSVDKDGANNLWDFENDVLTKSITLYAQWLRLYRVTFNLNNPEALQSPPAEQSVEEGACAVRPEIDPVLDGYKFEGWYTTADCIEEFDFNNTTINTNITIYAKWSENKVGTLDVELPEYTYREEAPYGERPDLEGYIIDGKMGEAENWEDQNWYSTSITQAPTATLKLTTQMSEKGLYVFFQVEDNGGLYMMGKNWYDRNSNLLFHIYDGVITNTFRIDTFSLYPIFNKVKIAINIAEGEVNTANAENKRAVWNVEMFATWKDLRFDPVPDTVKIGASYNYKRLASDNIKFYLTTPFSKGDAMTAADYIDYDKNGYTKADAENATVGASSLGIAKTNGWDISHESDEENAYVSSNSVSTQAIFYKGVVDTNYYEFEFEVDGSSYTTEGKAGATIYSSDDNYIMLLFAVGSNTYDRKSKTFFKAKPYLKVTDKDGKLWTKILDEIDVSATGKIQVKVIFSNGYIYCILNDVLFHCEYVADLNVRTNPGLCTTEGGAGIKFKNYSARVLTADEARVETGKYAYVISKGRLRNLTIDLSTTGVSSKEGASKKVVMSLTNGTIPITNSQKNKILEDGIIDDRIQVNQIESFTFTVNGEAHNVIDALTDPETGAKWGEFVYEYPFLGDSVITNTTSVVPTEELTFIKGTIVDSITGNPIAANATITSNNPRLGKYDIGITGGQIVLVVPKGYDYKITFTQTAYRNTVLDVMTNVTEPQDIGQIKLVPNVLGGTAVSKKTNLTFGSSVAGWDMSNETNGQIIFETTGTNPPAVYFSGYTVHDYQYAKVSVTNITDIAAYTTYEKDPAIGFQIKTNQKTAFIGLRMDGLRYLHDFSYWGPIQIGGYGKNTCNVIDVTGEHKDTLEILRIKTSLYSWINGFYMGCIEMDDEFDGEAAIAVLGTFTYYGKIIYRDYEIQVGDAAVAIAKDRVGLTLDFADNAYDLAEGSYIDPDYNKPLVEIGGLTEILKDDLSREYIALAGNEITVTRSEFADPNEILNVSIGSYGSVILSTDNPTGTIKVPITANGKAIVSVVVEMASTITGKFEGVDSSVKGPFTGYVLLDNGNRLAFTTGEDGTFSVSVPVGTILSVKLKAEGFVALGVTTKSPSNAGRSKDIGTLTVYKTMLGGRINGTQYSSSSADYYEVSYDSDPDTVYEGEYLEAKTPGSGNFNIAINTRTFRDFDISFSMVRYESPESDPGFGLQLTGAGTSDQLLFHRNGVRCINSITGWAGKTEKSNLMTWSTQAAGFGKAVDLRVVRRGNTAMMFYRMHGDEEWILIYIQELVVNGSVGVFIQSANSLANHYIIWNVKANALNAENLPADLEANVTAKFAEGSDTAGTISISGGVKVGGVTKYYYGDNVTVTVKPNPGYTVAWAKVNGKLVDVVANKFTIGVTMDNIDVEILLETQFLTYDVTGKVVVDNTYQDFVLPKTVNVVAYMEDGRSYPAYDLSLDAEGKFTMSLREGTFKVYAYSPTLASKAIDAVISEENKDLGTMTLSVMRGGNVTVNGTTLGSGTLTEVFEQGMVALPGVSQDACWMPEAVTTGDFVFSTDMTQTGGVDSVNYTNDHVAGLRFSNGSAIFGIQFWHNGFRISNGGWSTTEMIWPHQPEAVAQYFVDNLAEGQTRTHNLAVKRVGATLAVYVDGKHLFTLSSEKGFEWAPGVTGTEGYPANVNRVKDIFSNVFGNSESEIAVGFGCNLSTSGSYVNKSGFSNMVLTNKADIVNSFNGTL